ncbi:MAG: hypothetical protein V4542_08985 [Pseudomonadota bacterium]
MKRLFPFVFALVACVALFGCAHPISMNPNLQAITAPAGTQAINKQVGYHIPEALRQLQVISPGGGGDKVSYFPYRDLEPGFYKVLSETFRDVSKVQDPKNAAELSSRGIKLLITPEITTTSSSESLFTWPPTMFSVTLVCTVTDMAGQGLQTIRVVGNGNATFDEFKGNLSLAAVRASDDALAKLLKELTASAELRK